MAKPDLVDELTELARRAAKRAVAMGAEAAEALCSDGIELTAKVRMGEPELVQEAGSRALGLRVFRDRRSAVTYTSDLSPDALDRFVEETVELAALSEPDELNVLPDEAEMARAPLPELDLYDERALGVTAADALAIALEGERAARAYSPKVTNSEGATYSRVAGASAFAVEGKGRAGFAGGERSTYVSLVVEPICDDADGKKRNGYHWTSSRFVAGLESAESVGIEAARRTVAKLGAEKISTGVLPVVFDPDSARALVRALVGVISGGAIYRRSSYLVDREGTAVASPLLTMADDPLLKRAPGSRPFDGDGLASRKNLVIEAGVLRTFLLDVYSARKLGRRSNGCAGRSIGGSPHVSTSNFLVEPATGRGTPRAEILAPIERGLYVTDLMGFGFNPATGDFSRGASGFLIERGQLGKPVTEVTVSSNFDALWKAVDAVGDDPDRRASTICPTLRVAEMMVAGR